METNFNTVPFKPQSILDAGAIYEAAEAIRINGGINTKSLEKSLPELEALGIKVTTPMINSLLKTGAKVDVSSITGQRYSFATPQDSYAGTYTWELSNALIQDYAPSTTLDESPFNIMLPMKSVDGLSYQQDILASMYGYADGDNGAGAGHNVLPMLTTSSNNYKGFAITETSSIENDDLRALREVGTNDTKRKAVIQKLNWQTIFMVQRVATGIELNRIESLIKGSWTWSGFNQTSPIIIGSGLTNAPRVLSQSLGSYSLSNNKFTLNPNITIDPLKELGDWLTAIFNAGLDFDEIISDNIVYGAIFQTLAVDARTIYQSAVSTNNIQDNRDNLFRNRTIPALQGRAILVDNRSFKTDSNPTTTANTRPMLWGKTVSSSSFRIIVRAKPKGLSRIGDMALFPNLYARNTNILGGGVTTSNFGGTNGILVATQDLAVSDITNQKIQLLSAVNVGYMIYLPNMVFSFDLGVTITA